MFQVALLKDTKVKPKQSKKPLSVMPATGGKGKSAATVVKPKQ